MPRALMPAIRAIGAVVLVLFVMPAWALQVQQQGDSSAAQICQAYMVRIVAPAVVMRDLEANRRKVAELLLAQASPEERAFFEREIESIWAQGLPIRAVLEDFYRRCTETGA